MSKFFELFYQKFIKDTFFDKFRLWILIYLFNMFGCYMTYLMITAIMFVNHHPIIGILQAIWACIVGSIIMNFSIKSLFECNVDKSMFYYARIVNLWFLVYSAIFTDGSIFAITLFMCFIFDVAMTIYGHKK